MFCGLISTLDSCFSSLLMPILCSFFQYILQWDKLLFVLINATQMFNVFLNSTWPSLLQCLQHLYSVTTFPKLCSATISFFVYQTSLRLPPIVLLLLHLFLFQKITIYLLHFEYFVPPNYSFFDLPDFLGTSTNCFVTSLSPKKELIAPFPLNFAVTVVATLHSFPSLLFPNYLVPVCFHIQNLKV